MKKNLVLVLVTAIMLVSSVVYAQTVKDLQKDFNMNKVSASEEPMETVSSGKIYSILSMGPYHSKDQFKATGTWHGVEVAVRVKKLESGAKTVKPEIIKIYLYNSYKVQIGMLDFYFIKNDTLALSFRKGEGTLETGKTQRLYFKLDQAVMRKVKTYVAVIGSPDEEVVARKSGSAQLDDLRFAEKKYIDAEKFYQKVPSSKSKLRMQQVNEGQEGK